MLGCSKCNKLSNINETLMFAVVSKKKDFICSECIKQNVQKNQVSGQVKDVEKAIQWTDEMGLVDESIE